MKNYSLHVLQTIHFLYIIDSGTHAFAISYLLAYYVVVLSQYSRKPAKLHFHPVSTFTLMTYRKETLNGFRFIKKLV